MRLSLNVARFPDRGELVKDEGGISYSPAGAGGNCAVSLARLGADAVLVTRLGQDLYGQRLYTYYKDSGVNTSHIRVDKERSTGLTVTVKEADGGLRELVFSGANEQLSADGAIDALAERPDGVFLSFDFSFNSAVKLARLSASRTIPIFINAHPADANQALEALPESELFILTEDDARRYTGIKSESSQDQLRVAFSLWRKIKSKYIVVNYADRGAMIYDGKRCEMLPPFSYDKPIDKDGAADAFATALTSEYIRTGLVKHSAAYALAAAAVCASRYGSSSSVPTDSELREIISSH